MQLLLRDIRQLVTVRSGGKPFLAGKEMRDPGILEHVSVLVEGDTISEIGPAEAFDRSLEQDATIVNDTSVREWTPLHLVARKGHYDSSGDQTAEDEETDPKGYFKTAQFLITKGANFNAIAFDENGAEWTPLALTQNQGIKDLINSQAPSSSLSMANVLGVQQVAGGRSQSSRGNF